MRRIRLTERQLQQMVLETAMRAMNEQATWDKVKQGAQKAGEMAGQALGWVRDNAGKARSNPQELAKKGQEWFKKGVDWFQKNAHRLGTNPRNMPPLKMPNAQRTPNNNRRMYPQV